jgi:hypothetical protein
MQEKRYRHTELLDQTEAAEVLHTNPRLLENWRRCKRGPRFMRLVGSVRYRYADLVEFMQRGTVETTDSRALRSEMQEAAPSDLTPTNDSSRSG